MEESGQGKRWVRLIIPLLVFTLLLVAVYVVFLLASRKKTSPETSTFRNPFEEESTSQNPFSAGGYKNPFGTPSGRTSEYRNPFELLR